MALNVAPLRESKKSFLNGTVKQYGEEAKRKFHATAQRRNVKDSIPQIRQIFNGLGFGEKQLPERSLAGSKAPTLIVIHKSGRIIQQENKSKIPRIRSSGVGGHPGTTASTGITLATAPQLA